jgi:entry exclusion lipoprotein TrbK
VRFRRAAIASAAVAAVVAAVLTGCSPIVALKPAPHANDSSCADVIVRLPQTVQNLPRRETDAQSTGAWGDPAQVLLRCGVTVPTVSDLICVSVDGTYWLRDDSAAPSYVFTTYGRTPAVAVVIDQRTVSPGLVLDNLDSAVSFTKPNGRKCLSIEDSFGGDSASPTPSAPASPAPTTAP